LFMGRRAGWLVWGTGVAAWSVIALVGPEKPAPGIVALFDASFLPNWVRVITIYAALSAATLAVVVYLAGRMEKALRRSEALYAALTDESTRRIAALEEQRALEEQLRQAQKMEALGTLAGGVAHDFNNLLVVIINQAELAAQSDSSEAARQSLEQIVAAGERAASLTNRLLTFGRRQVGERRVLDLNARVQETTQLLRRLLPASIELECELDAARPQVRVAEVELDQIIMNLCVNARDAMPGGGGLKIRTFSCCTRAPGGSHTREFVALEVIDSGTGMDEATRARIFEPFFTTKKKGQGTGLGLATVHGLVEGSGGFIEVASRPGSGTTMRVLLPVYEGPELVHSATPRSVAVPGTETILIADDDPQVRVILARRLRDNGYRVIACQDGEAALAEYQKHASEIGLVISDAVMPKLGGRELHRRLSSQYGEIPFLICSGYAAQTVEPSFFDHPLRAFLQKPFNDRTLQERVRQLLDAGKAQRPAALRTFPLQSTVRTAE
ncbi:MAG TPA: ATP-binding protein, partial [Polyangiales bacterium]